MAIVRVLWGGKGQFVGVLGLPAGRQAASKGNAYHLSSMPNARGLGDETMITFKSFGHINIVVDDIEKATAFYQESFGARPVQDAPHFRNLGFAKAAGFLSNPEDVDVSIRFLALPVPAPVFLELMQYHSPKGSDVVQFFKTHDMGGPRHICLRVENVMEAFEHLKGCKGIRMINESADYRPRKLDDVHPRQFRLFDSQLEANKEEKEKMSRSASNTRFFYVIDPYGVQWEIEQGD